MKMQKVLYLVTVIGVFLQITDGEISNGQNWDTEIMERCPCDNEIIEDFLESVAQNSADVENGQKLRLRLWQLKTDVCKVNVLDKSPKPGQIEISMMYHGSIQIERPGEGQDQDGDDDDQPQQGMEDYDGDVQQGNVYPQYQQGPQQGAGDIGPEQYDEDVGPQQDEDTGSLQDKDIEEFLGSIDFEQMQQSLGNGQQNQGTDTGKPQQGTDTGKPQQGTDTGKPQQGTDTGKPQQSVAIGHQQEQEQSGLSQGSSLGNGKDSSAEFTFTIDVNTGNLSYSRIKRRRRELMPFETVKINMEIIFEKSSDPDVEKRNDQIKHLLEDGLREYWLAMAFCLLGVEQ
ncbi:uncharacterized protein [Engystomops pustulosus]